MSFATKRFRLTKRWNARQKDWRFQTEVRLWWWPWWYAVEHSDTENEKDAQTTYIIVVANRGNHIIIAKET